MFNPIRKAFRRKSSQRAPRLPEGERVYAIGDIHGRRDLFDALVAAIEKDDRKSGKANTTIVLLGDLIDRGPDSAGVIKAARALQDRHTVRYLIGNHEEMLLDAFKSIDVMRHFLKHGGRETILSYGVSIKTFNGSTTEELQKMMKALIPKSDRNFIKGFEEIIEIGDYVFVHAGIDPERPVSEQRRRDTRWIRDPFLNSTKQHSHMIVHGHTIAEEIDQRANRIGLDTGAYKFGKLTAIVLQGTTRRYIQAIEDANGTILIQKRDAAQ
ncbi:metallophosphoesterase family protein [Pontixanthobacter sp.]|uniref:metallophosphoesterase family protein n=1 Tax=Pontixanthobacter sp. TaxID=2792078 RepID=UPI003C79DF8F